MEQFSQIKSRQIIVDTNILVYCGNKDFGHQAKGLLRILKNNGNALAISHASYFELIKNAIDDKLRDYYFSLVSYIHNISITPETLLSGCFLYHTYSNRGLKGFREIESFDLVISGTIVFHKGSLLLTANRRHFPMPFWKNIAQGTIVYKDGEEYRLINIYLLEFDYKQIPEKFKTEK